MTDLATLLSDPGIRRALAGMMEEARCQPVYAYPWTGLEEELARSGRETLGLVGYGSLMNGDSAARTLTREQVRGRRPVVAFGVRRVFNYPIPPGNRSYGGGGPAAGRPAALNVRQTYDIGDMVNGVLIDIGRTQLPDLCRRELNYDLVPVACLDWNRPESSPFRASILSCPETLCQEDGSTGTSDRLVPQPDYLRVCRQGAAEFGAAFLDLWLATTFLADGRTPIGPREPSSPREAGSGDA